MTARSVWVSPSTIEEEGEDGSVVYCQVFVVSLNEIPRHWREGKTTKICIGERLVKKIESLSAAYHMLYVRAKDLRILSPCLGDVSSKLTLGEKKGFWEVISLWALLAA